jgi:Uma2 family endonuclease
MELVKSISSRLKSPIERYLDRENKSDRKHEFLNGKIRKRPGSSYNHNKIAANFIISIGQLINEKKLPFEVISSDQKIYIPQLHQILYPDALVVYQKPEFWNHRKDVLLNPILIFEILSPSTEAYDLTTKFMSFKHIPSFKEYVMVNQDKKGIETWYREEEHLWRETVYHEEDTSLELKSVGINIDIEKIYRNIEF